MDIEHQELWTTTLEILKTRVTKPTFDTWFKNTQVVAAYDHQLVIEVDNPFAKKTITDMYMEDIHASLLEASGERFEVSFVMPGEAVPEEVVEKPEVDAQVAKRIGLRDSYVFDTFVVGKSNNFAQSVSLAIAEQMSHSLTDKKDYNPLFIHGGSGLGKTHLMHAVAWHILEHMPHARIRYVSTESFMNEYVDAIQNSRMPQFHEKYRNCDILLVDDVQFLADKKGFQEEIFHTFNELYNKDGQIILTSDRPPSEINHLEDRLQSRFAQGIVADIQPPDLETRMAILRKKAELERIEVPDDVTLYIAEHVSSNIRELEGALTSVSTFAVLMNLPITVEMAQEQLSNYGASPMRRSISIEDIQEAVADLYKIKIEDMTSRKRHKNIAFPRQVAMYLSRELTEESLPSIGKAFGGRDHTTIMHGVEKVQDHMNKDVAFKMTVNNLRNKLSGDR